MPSSLTPGSSDIASVQYRDADAAFAEIRAARHSQHSRNPFHAGPAFEASLVRICYGLSGCSPPWTDLTEFPRPPGAFTSRLPTGRSPFPSLDMTTTASGLLCWRDFHPQERQLASLHQTQRVDRALVLPQGCVPVHLISERVPGEPHNRHPIVAHPDDIGPLLPQPLHRLTSGCPLLQVGFCVHHG